MGDTSVVSFAAIDKSKAVEESVRIVVPKGPAGLSHRILAALDYYCINPKCDCETAHLDVFRLEGEIEGFEVDPAARTFRRVGDVEYKTDIAKDPVRMEVDLSRGAVGFPKGHRTTEAEKEVMARSAAARERSTRSVVLDKSNPGKSHFIKALIQLARARCFRAHHCVILMIDKYINECYAILQEADPLNTQAIHGYSHRSRGPTAPQAP